MKIKKSEIKEIIRQALNEVSSSDIKELEAIVKELAGASKMHKSQSERIDKIVKSVSKTEEKLNEKVQRYVVGLENGEVMSGDKSVTEKRALQIMSRISKRSDGWVNPFMIGVEAWNGTHPKSKGKPHKMNKKKIMVGEGKLTNEAIDLKDAGGEIFDTIIAFKKIYEKSPHKKNRKINMYIKQLLKIEQQISDVIGDLD